MLGHAPPPLAEVGLDMRGGHPAGIRSGSGRLSQDEVLKPRRLLRRKRELSCTDANRKQDPRELDRTQVFVRDPSEPWSKKRTAIIQSSPKHSCLLRAEGQSGKGSQKCQGQSQS